MSESMKTHDKLYKLNVLSYMCSILKEDKHPKLHRQVLNNFSK